MPRPQSLKTIVKLLKPLHARLTESGFSSYAEDRALRAAIKLIEANQPKSESPA